MWLLACGGPVDAELASQRKALDAFERAEAALEDKQPDAALAALEDALKERPKDPLLQAWSASILAEQGRLDEALTRLDKVLDARPSFAEARYNRAAYLARLGRFNEAGPDLRRALEEGISSPRAAMVDPDFRPHRNEPAFDYLPASSLEVSLGEIPERAFLGSEVPVTLTIAALSDPDGLRIDAMARGPVRLVGTLENRVAAGDDTVNVELRWTLGVEAPGNIDLGPFGVRVGGEVHNEARRTVAGVGPAGSVDGEAVLVALETPTSLAAGLELDRPVLRDERVFVRVEVNAQVTTHPAVPPLGRHERRTAGQPDWVVWVFPAVKEVMVRGVGGERFKGPPAPSPR